MKHISQLVNQFAQQTESKPTAPKCEQMKKPSISSMIRLWETMGQIWGHQWEKSFGSTPSEGWMEALRGVTPDMMALGFNRLVEKSPEWPPNAMQFKALCKPTGEDLGLLPEHEAYQQAITRRKADRAPEVVFTMRAMGGSFDFGQKKSKEAEKQFSDWYAKTIDHVLNGGKLPKPELKIEDKPVMTPNKEGQAKIQAIMAMINE